MLKFKMLLFAVVGAFAVLSTAVAAGEELREAGAVIKENGWANFEEVLALAEAGKLKTGEFRYDWPILMAKFRTGKITARELWTQCHALAHNPPTSDELWPLWFTLPRHIVQYGNDPEFSEEVLSALKSDAAGDDAVRRQAAARGLAEVLLMQNKVAEAWPYLCEPNGKARNMITAAQRILADELLPAGDVYAGIRTAILRRGNTTPAELLSLTRLLMDSGVRAAIPQSEIKSTLEQISLLYVSFATGDSDSAKAWAEVIGAVEETAKRCR